MFIAFSLEGIGIYALLLFASSPTASCCCQDGLPCLGPDLRRCPCTCTDIYGRKFATATTGCLYGQGTAALCSRWPLLTRRRKLDAVLCGIGAHLIAATLALVALKTGPAACDGENVSCRRAGHPEQVPSASNDDHVSHRGRDRLWR